MDIILHCAIATGLCVAVPAEPRESPREELRYEITNCTQTLDGVRHCYLWPIRPEREDAR